MSEQTELYDFIVKVYGVPKDAQASDFNINHDNIVKQQFTGITEEDGESVATFEISTNTHYRLADLEDETTVSSERFNIKGTDVYFLDD